MNGYKDIENRTWPTHFRGRFLVHAAKTIDKAGIEQVRRRFPQIKLPNSFDRQGIVGEAEMTGCVSDSHSEWFSGPFGFTLRNAKPLPFQKCSGRLNFFKVEVA